LPQRFNPFRKNLDLHGDLHAIEFAPYGSFVPSPSQIQIVFVASDGGFTKGSFDSNGMVSWEPLTKGSRLARQTPSVCLPFFRPSRLPDIGTTETSSQ